MKEDQIFQLLEQGKIEKAFVKLYKVYPTIKSMLKKYGAGPDLCRDIFQDALVVLFEKLQQENFSIQTSMEAYLTNTCKYMYLKSQKAGAITIELGEIEQEEVDIVVAMLEEKKIQQAEAALKQIGERCREILLSFYMGKKTMAEIARQYAYSSENVAKTQKYKCLEAARKTYQKMINS
jgi:RNA polymerase sigma factor (sigma-70 family)